MSVVIAVKDRNRFVLGSDKQASTGSNKDHNATKIWELRDLPGAILGCVGAVRAAQVIQYSDIIDKNAIQNGEINTEFVICVLLPVMIAALEHNGVCCTVSNEETGIKSKVLPNAFLFAYKDRAWMIWNDLSVVEIEDYLAIGSGADVATGALYATKDKNPFERIVTCIDAAAESTLYVDHGIDLLATEMYKADEKLINKALGLDVQADMMQALAMLHGKSAQVEAAEEVAAEVEEEAKPVKKVRKSKVKAKETETE